MTDPEAVNKREYEAPVLVVLGRIEDMTRAAPAGPFQDAHNGCTFS